MGKERKKERSAHTKKHRNWGFHVDMKVERRAEEEDGSKSCFLERDIQNYLMKLKAIQTEPRFGQ